MNDINMENIREYLNAHREENESFKDQIQKKVENIDGRLHDQEKEVSIMRENINGKLERLEKLPDQISCLEQKIVRQTIKGATNAGKWAGGIAVFSFVTAVVYFGYLLLSIADKLEKMGAGG